jgi:hypothetical protein
MREQLGGVEDTSVDDDDRRRVTAPSGLAQ